MLLQKQFQPNVTSYLIVLEAAVCLVQGFTTLLRCCCSNFSSCYVSPFRFFCHLFSAKAKEVHKTTGNKSYKEVEWICSENVCTKLVS